MGAQRLTASLGSALQRIALIRHLGQPCSTPDGITGLGTACHPSVIDCKVTVCSTPDGITGLGTVAGIAAVTAASTCSTPDGITGLGT